MSNLRALLLRLNRLEQAATNAADDGPPVRRMSMQDMQAELLERSGRLLETPHRAEALGWLRQVASTGVTGELQKRAVEMLAAAAREADSANLHPGP